MSGDNPYVRFSVLKTTDILDAPYPVYVPADCSVSVVAVLEPSDVSERCDISAVDLSNVLADNPAYDETDPDETDPEQLEVGLAGITIRTWNDSVIFDNR